MEDRVDKYILTSLQFLRSKCALAGLGLALIELSDDIP